MIDDDMALWRILMMLLLHLMDGVTDPSEGIPLECWTLKDEHCENFNIEILLQQLEIIFLIVN